MIIVEITDAAKKQLKKLSGQTGKQVFKITKEYT